MQSRVYQDSGEAPEEGFSFIDRMRTGVSTAIGAVTALGVIFALGIWFYRLGDRDAQSVPIIRADAGPTKKIPDDPGGQKTPHQGIKSYEAAGGSAATASAAVIAAAPPEPKPEDVPMGKLVPVGKPGGGETGPGDANATDEATPAPDVAVESPDAAVPADGERLAAAPDAATITPAPPARRPERPVADTAAVEEPETGDAGAVRPTVPDEELIIPGATARAPDKSPYAPRRPQNLAARNKAAAETAVEEKRDLAAEAARSPVQIQLIADPDRDVVVRLWKVIYRENVDILQGRALAVQSTVSGGVTWYRLRVGPFKSRSEAASVCQALKARQQDCIVSRNS